MTTTKTDAQTVLEVLEAITRSADNMKRIMDNNMAYLDRLSQITEQALPAAQRLVDAQPTTSEEA